MRVIPYANMSRAQIQWKKVHITTTHRGRSHNELGKVHHHCKIQNRMQMHKFQQGRNKIKNSMFLEVKTAELGKWFPQLKIYCSSDNISISMVKASLGTSKRSKPKEYIQILIKLLAG